MKTLYHYTTIEGKNMIISTNTIMPSNPITTMDAAYGNGYYLTDISPDKCEMDIALKCWRSIDALDKVRAYFKFEVEDGIYQKCRENVYLIQNWDTNKIKFIEAKEVQSCPKYPCLSCDQGKNLISKFQNK